ncbi:hypothetical protein EX30DRAFT_331603 [Ascodesmis nigricans]|uniref:Pyridoxamine 5'-phosphate oxidase N-terminal domain-containing protein n=1 Tax=Ascodesmis nigricans TaxID=341454 RepID=A0A4S2MW10_9PEZI|nr:hypothetical protein EX30DRAFT_331603 [Ascodesmis nigricans]
MPKYYTTIPAELQDWILEQPVFWVGTAPKRGKHINISPKGTYSALLHLHSPTKLSYIDVTGSGSETISHLYDNGRITVMFNSFSTSPRIVRLFGRGTVTERDDARFDQLLDEIASSRAEKQEKGEMKAAGYTMEQMKPTIRSVITVDVFKVQSTCGYGVPIVPPTQGITSSPATAEEGIMKEEKLKADIKTPRFDDRPTILKWGVNKAQATSDTGKSQMEEYWVLNNSRSLDGLPGTRMARMLAGESLWVGEVIAWVKRWRDFLLGILVAVVLMVWLDNQEIWLRAGREIEVIVDLE